MAYDTYIQTGRFISTGEDKVIELRGDIDWMEVYNTTDLYAGGAGRRCQFYWQRGMANGRGLAYSKLAADDSLAPSQIPANAGFFYIDTSTEALGDEIATTQIDATPTVYTGNTTGLVDGDTVRILDQTGAQQLGGMDFTIGGLVANTSFDLEYMVAIVGTGAAAGSYRRVPSNGSIFADNTFIPNARYITDITQAANAVITLSVTHTYAVGDWVRIVCPDVFYGMTQIDQKRVKITAISALNNTITVDLDTTGYTAFTFPLTAEYPVSHAMVMPAGTSTTTIESATVDQGYIGMLLTGGAGSPGGDTDDIMYWKAGKAFSNS